MANKISEGPYIKRRIQNVDPCDSLDVALIERDVASPPRPFSYADVFIPIDPVFINVSDDSDSQLEESQSDMDLLSISSDKDSTRFAEGSLDDGDCDDASEFVSIKRADSTLAKIMSFTKLIKIDLWRRRRPSASSVVSRGRRRSGTCNDSDTADMDMMDISITNDKGLSTSSSSSNFEIGPLGISSDYTGRSVCDNDDKTKTEESQGVIYHIATWHGKRPYANPHLCGLVKVFISSTLQGNVKEILDRKAVLITTTITITTTGGITGRCCDNDDVAATETDGGINNTAPTRILAPSSSSLPVPVVVAACGVCTHDLDESWITLDFGKGRQLLPTRYRLKYGGGHSLLGSCAPRNWQLRARVDEKSHWKVLYDHEDDDSLADEAGAIASWEITCPKPTIWGKIVGRKPWDETLGFRFFQIIQTGPNSSGNNVLSLGGVEFFGRLTETEEIYFASYFQHDLPSPSFLNRDGGTTRSVVRSVAGTGAGRAAGISRRALASRGGGRTRSQSALIPLNRRLKMSGGGGRKSTTSQLSGSTDSMQLEGGGLCCVPFCCVK